MFLKLLSQMARKKRKLSVRTRKGNFILLNFDIIANVNFWVFRNK